MKLTFTNVLSILVLIFSVLVLQDCSNDSPTKPEDSNIPTTTANIGSSGGSINIDNLEIIIPPGAFQLSQEINISKSTEENLFNTNALSDFYVLDGLPLEILKPFKIKIKYSGTITDSSFLAVGENNFISSLNEEKTSYHLISAKDSAGFLIASIPPTYDLALGKSTNNYSTNADNLTINLGAIAGYVSYTSEQKHFKISFPASVLTQTYDLANILEEAYAKYISLGFSYSRRTKWPVEVTVKDLRKANTNVYGYTSNSFWGDNYGYMEFNFYEMGNLENMSVAAGHEFFHLVQNLYDPRNRISKYSLSGPNYWLYEASSVWAEEFFSSAKPFTSSIFESHAETPLLGAKASVGEDEEKEGYGYGMSSFLKFLTNKYGDNIIANIYKEIYKGSSPFDAINKSIPSTASLLWNEYIKNYLSFNIYKGSSFNPSWFQGNPVKRLFHIDDATDTLKTFSYTYSDLTASASAVINRFKNLESTAQLLFEAPGNADNQILLFKVNKNESVYIKQGHNTVMLDNFKSITDAGYIIISVVTDNSCDAPYSHQNPVDLTIHVKSVQAPTIKNIIPDTAKVGTVVQINGNNFGTSQSTGEVWFGSLKASDITSWNDTQIDVKVPQGLAAGNVDVHIVANGKKSNYVNFTVLEENDPNAGYWVLYDTKPINGCEFYESDCWPLENCSGSAGNYSITVGSSTCGSNASGSTGSGSYTIPPSILLPGETLTFDVTASDKGYTSVWISFYSDINNMSFDDHGYNTGESSSWSNKIVSCNEDSSPFQGKYEIPLGLEKEGAILIDGGGSIGTFDTSRHYLFLYKWHE